MKGRVFSIKKFEKPKMEIIDQPNLVLKAIKEHYFKDTLGYMTFSTDIFPPSTNAQYNKKVVRGKLIVENTKEVEMYRNLVWAYFREHKIKFEKNSILAVVVEMYSPKWVNKDLTPKRKDLDNPIKPLFDAFAEASNIPDEMIFQFHPFKLYAREDKIVCHIFQLENKIHTH